MIKEHFPASNDRKVFKNNKDGGLLASLCDSEADNQGMNSPPKYMNRSNNMIVLDSSHPGFNANGQALLEGNRGLKVGSVSRSQSSLILAESHQSSEIN